jgi:hypothetical protein
VDRHIACCNHRSVAKMRILTIWFSSHHRTSGGEKLKEFERRAEVELLIPVNLGQSSVFPCAEGGETLIGWVEKAGPSFKSNGDAMEGDGSEGCVTPVSRHLWGYCGRKPHQ